MPAFFTIVSANYIAFAATLMQSVRQFHPDAARFIILADDRRDFGDIDLAAELVACDDLGIALIANMKLWYSVIEFNTAVKPFAFHHLFATRGYDSAIYLDPDIQLYAPLGHVLAALDGHSLVLTPHMVKPLQDGKHPSDLAIMKSGVYNLGFAALRNDGDGRDLLAWWCDRLFAHCRIDIAGNIFTDQRWMDLAPAFVEHTKLLRHPGYNIAYWNLAHRTVACGEDGVWRANGEPLAFFHYSGIDPLDPAVFSKHQNRFSIETLGPVAELCRDYRARVLGNGWQATNTLPYAYARFSDGRPIEPAMRHWVLEAVDDGRLTATRPLGVGSAFFDAADERRFAGNGRLTRFAHQLWRDRPDLQGAFNIQRQEGLDGYVGWFCDGSADGEGVPPRLIEAARALRDQPNPPAPAQTLRPAPPPWPPMASDAWSGPASDVTQWLRGELRFELHGVRKSIQRQAALLWERRVDLQRFFPILDGQGLEDYQVWCLTDGMREGSIVADLFSEDYARWLTAPSSLSSVYDDVPITNAMALTRRSEHGRDALQNWHTFPIEKQARFEQAFWFAFIAPRLFGWPGALVAPVRTHLQQPSGLSVSGYALPRAVLACHELREDTRLAFPLQDEAGRWQFLVWLLLEGARDFGTQVEDLCPGLAVFLGAPSPDYPLLSRLAKFAYDQRQDLQDAFDLRTRAGIAGLQAWAKGELAPWLATVGLSGLLRPEPEPEPRVHTDKVALSGDWTATSGVGEDMRSSEAALRAAGFVDYVIVDLQTGVIHDADGVALPPGTAVAVQLNIVHHNADTAVADWLALRRLRVAARHVVGHWHWELERLPSWWVHAFAFCDEVWASSRFAADAFAAEARRPVRLLNGAVTVPDAAKLPRPGLRVREQATLFLFMFDWASYASRKNPGAVIEAFHRAFPAGNEAAQLLVKTQNAALLPELSGLFGASIDDDRIVFLDQQMTRPELVGLVAAADAFVSLHRSEGYGRAPAEAMLLGIPVIVTGYSGTADYADPDCACIVDYTLVPVAQREYPGVEGQRWAEADVAQATGYMRWIHENPRLARQLGERGRTRIATRLAPATVGAAMVELIGAITGTPTADRPVGMDETVAAITGGQRTVSMPHAAEG